MPCNKKWPPIEIISHSTFLLFIHARPLQEEKKCERTVINLKKEKGRDLFPVVPFNTLKKTKKALGIFGSPQEKLTLIDQYFHITMVTEYSLLFLGPPPINLLSWIIQAPQKDSDSLEAFTSLHLFLTAPGDFFSLSLSLCYILDIFYLQEPHRGENNLRSLALVFKVSLAAGVCGGGGGEYC